METMDMPKTVVVIPHMVHQKIMHWVRKGGSHECSGLGVTKNVDGRIMVVDAIMIKQENGWATTGMDAQEVTRAMYRMRNADGELNFWWHSHADMDVFWSSTDRDTIAQIGKAGFCVASVFNKKGKVKTAIAAVEPFSLFIDDVETKVQCHIDKETMDAWDKEYDDNVVKKTYPNYGGYSSYGHAHKTEWTRSDDGAWHREGQLPIGMKAGHQTTLGFGVTQKEDSLGMPAVEPNTEESQSRWDYAMDRDDIVNYYSFSDQFEMYDGSFVDAAKFIENNPSKQEVRVAMGIGTNNQGKVTTNGTHRKTV